MDPTKMTKTELQEKFIELKSAYKIALKQLENYETGKLTAEIPQSIDSPNEGVAFCVDSGIIYVDILSYDRERGLGLVKKRTEFSTAERHLAEHEILSYVEEFLINKV